MLLASRPSARSRTTRKRASCLRDITTLLGDAPRLSPRGRAMLNVTSMRRDRKIDKVARRRGARVHSGRGGRTHQLSVQASCRSARRASCRTPPSPSPIQLEYGRQFDHMEMHLRMRSVAKGERVITGRRSDRDRRNGGRRGRSSCCADGTPRWSPCLFRHRPSGPWRRGQAPGALNLISGAQPGHFSQGIRAGCFLGAWAMCGRAPPYSRHQTGVLQSRPLERGGTRSATASTNDAHGSGLRDRRDPRTSQEPDEEALLTAADCRERTCSAPRPGMLDVDDDVGGASRLRIVSPP